MRGLRSSTSFTCSAAKSPSLKLLLVAESCGARRSHIPGVCANFRDVIRVLLLLGIVGWIGCERNVFDEMWT